MTLKSSIPTDCPPTLAEMLKQCWCENPEDRPDFKAITQFFADFEIPK